MVRRFASVALLAFLLGPPASLAQELTEVSQTAETMHVLAGETFEILAVADDSDFRASWIVTRDQEFVEAGSNKDFRIRLTVEGEYKLEAAVDLPSSSTRFRKEITIVVDPRAGAPAAAAPDFAHFSPAPQDGESRLHRDTDILAITPSRDLPGEMRLDLDTNVDADGNGDTSDDNDAAGTLFMREKNPLHVWFAEPREVRSVRVLSPESGRDFALDVLRTDDEPPSGQPQTPVGPTEPEMILGEISAQVAEDGQARFEFPVEMPVQDTVYHWSFGDGAQSLITRPSHRYMRSGDYDVTVVVRNLADGSSVARGETTVTVEIAEESVSSVAARPDPETPPDKPDPKPAEPSSGSGILGLLLRILGVALSAVLIGALGMLGIRKFTKRGGGLSKRLEDAEAKMMSKNKASGAIDVPPPPMELKRSTPADPPQEEKIVEKVEEAPKREKKPKEKKAELTPPPTDFVDVNAAPSWLKKGLTSEPAAGTPPPPPPPALAPAPEPAPLPPEPLPVPPPAPKPTPETPASLPPVEMDKAPTWLQQGLAKADPAPAPMPAAPAPVENAATASVLPDAAATPLPSEEDLLPDWMRQPAPRPADAPPLKPDPALSAPLVAPADIDLTQTPPWLQQGLAAATTETSAVAAAPATPAPAADAPPPWLQAAEPAPAQAVQPAATTVTAVATTPLPVIEPPAPVALAVPAPVLIPVPEPAPAMLEPAVAPEPTSPAPTPIVPTPVAEVPLPAILPVSVPEPAIQVAQALVVATPAEAPAPVTPIPTPVAEPPAVPMPEPIPAPTAETVPVVPPVAPPTPINDAEQQERDERERERKRRKRMRYRDNLKKRREEPGVPGPVPPAQPPSSPSPTLAATPAMPATPMEALKPVSAAEPAPPAPAADDIAFMIRADDVPLPKPPDGSGQAA